MLGLALNRRSVWAKPATERSTSNRLSPEAGCEIEARPQPVARHERARDRRGDAGCAAGTRRACCRRDRRRPPVRKGSRTGVAGKSVSAVEGRAPPEPPAPPVPVLPLPPAVPVPAPPVVPAAEPVPPPVVTLIPVPAPPVSPPPWPAKRQPIQATEATTRTTPTRTPNRSCARVMRFRSHTFAAGERTCPARREKSARLGYNGAVLAPALAVGVVLLSAHAPASATPAGSPAELARGFAAYRAGEYATATKALRAALAKGVRNEDWAQYLLAESEFYEGAYRERARAIRTTGARSWRAPERGGAVPGRRLPLDGRGPRPRRGGLRQARQEGEPR